MKLTYKYDGEKKYLLKKFILEQGISRKLLAKIKFQGGKIEVNGEEKTVRYELSKGDEVMLTLPEEKENENVTIDKTPLDILYEDEHLLIVNKPPYVASVPVSAHLEGTMVNRVKYHLASQGAENKTIHTVTRLDRDTTGAMIFAKSGYVHSLMDKKLRNHEILKYYQVLVHNHSNLLENHDIITAKIARKDDSIIERIVDETRGKDAKTEYWILFEKNNYAYLEVLLHTGRTHQIRVHLTYLDSPLLGDTLYNKYDSKNEMPRQALHCAKLKFNHPVTNELIEIKAKMPEDMQNCYDKYLRSDIVEAKKERSS